MSEEGEDIQLFEVKTHPFGEGEDQVDGKSQTSSFGDQGKKQKYYLHELARDNKYEALEDIPENLLNELDDEGNSPLHWAAKYSHEQGISQLLKLGADVNLEGDDGMTPLHYAARYGKRNHDPRGSVYESFLKPNDEDKPKYRWSHIDSFSESMVNEEDPIVNSIRQLLNDPRAQINKPDNYGLTPLHHAAMRGNLQVVHTLLKQPGIDVNFADKQESIPLHIAATYNNPAVLKMLLMAGSDAHKADRIEQTALHKAAKEGNMRCVLFLLEKIEEKEGEEKVIEILSTRDEDGCTPLILSIESGDARVVKLLLDKDQNGHNVNICNNRKEGPLHIAARSRNLEAAKLLIQFEAQYDMENELQQTPLFLTAIHNSGEVMEYLIELKANISIVDKHSMTPLLEAVAKGNDACVKQLLKAGADIDQKNKKDHNAIHMAAKHNQPETLEILLAHTEETTNNFMKCLNCNDNFDNTALHLASQSGHLESAKILLNHEADIDNKNEDEQTPCHLAVINGHLDIVKLIIEKDRNAIYDKDENENTPLHLAAQKKHDAIVKIILKNGASVQEKNGKEWTALDCAAANGATKSAKLLLEYDAPVDALDITNTTPLQLAAKYGHDKTVQLLLDYGADLSIKNCHNQNALEIAIIEEQEAVAKVILSHKNWDKAIRSVSGVKDNNGDVEIATPFRMLIRTFPKLAENVLDKCQSINDEKLELNFEFIEDTLMIKEEEQGFKFCHEPNEVPYNKKGRLRMDNHPLKIMADQEQKDLLHHPVSLALVRHKWNKFGKHFFLLSLIHYTTFLIFLTAYIQTSPNMLYPECHVKCRDPMERNSSLSHTCIQKGQYDFQSIQQVCQVGVLILATFGIMKEILEVYTIFMRYIQFGNIVDWFVYVMSVLFVINFDMKDLHYGTKECWQWKWGSFLIGVAWLNLLTVFQYFTDFGIYFLMFTKIFNTLTKFFLVFLIFLIAFSLGFNMLLLHQQPFENFGWSLLKTFVMMIGEMDYENIFDNDENNLQFEYASTIYFAAFLIMMAIIMYNLFVGLAVDDIQAVRRQAQLKNLSLRVYLILEWESLIPNFLVAKYYKNKMVITSVDQHNWDLASTIGIITEKKIIASAEKKTAVQTTHRSDHVQELRREIDTLNEKSLQMEKILIALAKKNEIEI